MIIREDSKLDNVARSIFETIFDEKWANLREDGVERAIYRDAARMALMTGAEWDITHPPEPALKLTNTPSTDGATEDAAKVREPSSSQAALKGGGRDEG